MKQEFLTVPEKLPASVAVVVEDSFTETRYERLDYTPKGQRSPSGDIKVKIGESSLSLLELTLPRLFERVVFVDAKDKAGGTDFIVPLSANTAVLERGARPYDERRDRLRIRVRPRQ